MKQILLNGVYREIKGEITHRAINPWMAKVGSGGTTYKDFSQAELEEYYDFRNGIGKKRGEGSDARLEMSEGVDFTTEGQAVLGPLITTAGTFGVAPVKIIDFQGATYAIGSDGTIQVWNVDASEWEHVQWVSVEDCEDAWNLFQHGNATHALDTSDYKVGSGAVKITVDSAIVNQMLAMETIGSLDLTGYTRIRAWIKSQLTATAGQLQLLLCSAVAWANPTGFTDVAGWDLEAQAYDDNTGNYARASNIAAQAWTDYLELTHAGVKGTQLRYWVTSANGYFTKMDIDVYYGSAWHSVVSEGSYTQGGWQTQALDDGGMLATITKVRFRFWNNHATTADSLYLNEVDFENSTVETVDVPALTADTWTRIVEDITTPANLATTTKVGIKSVADLGAEPYIIRVDDLQAEKETAVLASPIDAIVVTDATDEYFVVSSATAAKYSADAITWSSLDAKCMGYLAFYDTELRAFDTDGGTLHSSAANDIDGVWTEFNLTGQFGTVYDLFEGKLLADGTPTLYFCGTQGLYTIDTTNEIAYKQEVNYPPLTYSGHVGKYWNGSVWVSTGFGILKVTPSMATYIGPDLDDGLPEYYQGSVYDMETVNNWLVFCVNGGSFEAYNTGDDSSIAVFDSHWYAQTFTPLINHAIHGVKLLLWKFGSPGTITASIKAVDGSNQPTGADLCSGTTDGDTLPTASPYEWRTITFTTPYTLAANTKYAIVVRAPGGDVTNYGRWRGDNSSPSYTGGQLEYSADGGSTWAAQATWDMMFEEFSTTHAKSSILKRNASLGGNLQVYTSTAGKAITCLHHSPSSLYTNGRLWFGEGTDVKYMMFPDTTSVPKQIATYTYVDDSGYGTFPIFRKMAVIPKVALGVGAITKSCDANEYVEVFYGLNGAAATTSLGTFKTSPRPTILTFGSGLGTEFYTIQFAVKLYRGATTTNSPELESLLFYWLPRPSTISAWTFNVVATDENAEATIADFEAIRDTKTLVVFYPSGDPSKTSYNVALSTMPMRYVIENQSTRTGIIQVTLEQVFSG